MEISLRGKTAIVTGASRGIGKAIAKSFVDAGAQVMLTSRKLDALQAAAKEMDGETDVFAANAGEIDQAQACIDATIKRFGKIDILVNNAATNPYYGETLGVDSARFDKTFQVNLKGPLFWSQAVYNASMQKNPGVILNIASVGGLRAEQGLGVYNLTKAAVIHLTSQLACELGKTRVVGIAPGLVKTLFASVLVENFGDKLAAALPTKRLGEPQDIANPND
ncbi:MAG: SDR family oxidoreductase [Actinobacteria bacterium]|nr:SDR family oxidoreductase [Actinomycetota bacterium]